MGSGPSRRHLIVQVGPKPDARAKVKEDLLNFGKLLNIPNINRSCHKQIGKGLVIAWAMLLNWPQGSFFFFQQKVVGHFWNCLNQLNVFNSSPLTFIKIQQCSDQCTYNNFLSRQRAPRGPIKINNFGQVKTFSSLDIQMKWNVHISKVFPSQFCESNLWPFCKISSAKRVIW